VDALRELDPEDQLSVLQRMERLARSGASEGDLTGTLSRHEYDYVVVEGYAVVYRGMTHAELIAQGYERLASRGLVVLAVVQLSQIAEFLPQTSD
jgi:hypothetical protein